MAETTQSQAVAEKIETEEKKLSKHLLVFLRRRGQAIAYKQSLLPSEQYSTGEEGLEWGNGAVKAW